MARRVVITHTLITIGQKVTGQRAVRDEVVDRVKTGRQIQVDTRVVDQRIVEYRKTGEQKQVGERQVGEEVVRVEWKESPIPADRIRLRSIRGLHEAHRRRPSEMLLPEDLQEMRILTGRAQVLTHDRRVEIMGPVMVPVMEDVLEPVWEDVTEPVMDDEWKDVIETIWEPIHEPITRKRKHAVYLLMDCSYSMYSRAGGGAAWRMRLLRRVAHAVLERCVQEGVPFFCRGFDSEVYPLFTWTPGTPVEGLDKYIKSFSQQGTKISAAINVAIDDLLTAGVDTADLMIHTDGQDNELSQSLRRRLDSANVRMHVQLYGVENETLRGLAHTWSLSPTKNYISQVVENP
ncbi:MAG: hypothetical protein HQ488_00420 [Parcubacteria group bacterium]|nr:hypothetical protein [Parcubacteria group bacterium]